MLRQKDYEGMLLVDYPAVERLLEHAERTVYGR